MHNMGMPEHVTLAVAMAVAVAGSSAMATLHHCRLQLYAGTQAAHLMGNSLVAAPCTRSDTTSTSV
jgi:hypothetical protein